MIVVWDPRGGSKRLLFELVWDPKEGSEDCHLSLGEIFG